MSKDFYKNLQSVNDLSYIPCDENFEALPKDWHVLVCDIKNSTQAIQEGHYKQVNMISALSIVGILNIHKEEDYPFIFGGDGVTMLIPPCILQESQKVLLEAKKIAKDAYDLDLRVGSISMQTLHEKDKPIYVAKYAVCDEYNQAIIKGQGIHEAEKLLKLDNTFHITSSNSSFEVDFSGLECRWENIPTPKDETISILIKSLKTDTVYEQALTQIETIFGNKQQRNPITAPKINLSFNPLILNNEIALYTNNPFKKVLLFFKLIFENALGKILMQFKIGEWGKYKQKVEQTTDTEKFDDMLRMVVSATKEQTQALESYLQENYQKRHLIYGIHKADSALMTCLIFERHGKHIHFVDSSNGGYALAAKAMKDLAANDEDYKIEI